MLPPNDTSQVHESRQDIALAGGESKLALQIRGREYSPPFEGGVAAPSIDLKRRGRGGCKVAKHPDGYSRSAPMDTERSASRKSIMWLRDFETTSSARGFGNLGARSHSSFKRRRIC